MGEEGSEVQGELVNPVGRRECLDALHQAWKLQAVLQELLVWARRLRAEMDAPRAPSSPAEARHMLEEHQQRKVSGGTWAFPGIDPECCSCKPSLPPAQHLPPDPQWLGRLPGCRANFPSAPQNSEPAVEKGKGKKRAEGPVTADGVTLLVAQWRNGPGSAEQVHSRQDLWASWVVGSGWWAKPLAQQPLRLWL